MTESDSLTRSPQSAAELKATFQLPIIGVKKNPQSPMYTQLGVITKGTVIEVNVSVSCELYCFVQTRCSRLLPFADLVALPSPPLRNSVSSPPAARSFGASTRRSPIRRRQMA